MLASIENIQSDIFQDFLPHITFIKSLGEGTFAKVFLIFDQIEKNYLALKKISLFGLNDYQRKLVLNEAKILSSIQHPNIIRFHSCLYDCKQENVFIFMQYAKQGDLLNLIRKSKMKKQHLKQKIIWKIICDIALALNYLHQNNIIHRDVKPGNILQQGSNFKLADMNVSKIKVNGHKTCTNVGTPSYTSPEVVKNQFYNQKCDIWSLGVVIYELCCLQNPFTKESLKTLSLKNDNNLQSAIEKVPLYYSKSLLDLIRKMLRKNPEQRITIKQILQSCQNQGMQVGNIPSFKEIIQFKTIVLPSGSQRWVNLVQKNHTKRQQLDLTIDEILRQSEQQLVSQFNKDFFQNQKQAEIIKLIQDQYCLSDIKTKKQILKDKDKNTPKINNFVQQQKKPIKKPNHIILDQYRFLDNSDKQNSKQKIISTEKCKKFQRQKSRQKIGLGIGISRSKQKHHAQYGMKFIKLSKNLPSNTNS